MKKFFKILTCFILMIAVSVVLVACGKKEDKDPESSKQPQIVITEVSTKESLKTALSSTCDEIKLTSDITIDDTLVVTRKVTFNLNGKTINNTEDIWSEEHYKWSLVSVRANGDLTITGNGKLKAKENDCFAIDVMDKAKVTIENGTFVGNLHSVYVYEGTALINGGRFSIQQRGSKFDPETQLTGYAFVLNCYDANYKNETAKIIVKGGEFEKFNPANNPAESTTGTNFVATGYKSVKIDGTLTDYKVIAE